MAAVEPGNKHPVTDELLLEFSQYIDISAASVWVPDYEEDDELTLQCERVDANDIEQVTTNVEEVSSRPKAARQVRILDESQVLPGEASFATVSLNRPSEETTFEPRRPTESRNVDNRSRKESTHRIRLLDESQILSGEASYATVMLGERMDASSHSPMAEFLEKTRLTRHQLMLCGLLTVSILGFAVIVVLKLSTSEDLKAGFVPQTENRGYVPQNRADDARQTESTLSTKSIKLATVSTSREQVSSIANLNGVTANVKGIAGTAPISINERPNSEESRNISAKKAKSEPPVTATVHEDSPIASRVAARTVAESNKKLAEPTAKKFASARRSPAMRPAAMSVKSDEKKEPVSAPVKIESAPAVKKIEVTVLPVTGGGERPRTVTRRVN